MRARFFREIGCSDRMDGRGTAQSRANGDGTAQGKGNVSQRLRAGGPGRRFIGQAAWGLGLAWLVFLAVVSIRVTLPAIRSVDYLGIKQVLPLFALAGLYLAAGLVVGVLRSARLADLYYCLSAAGLGLLLILVAIGGGLWKAILVAVWCLLLFWGVGDRVLGLVLASKGKEKDGLYSVLALMLGMGIFSHAILALGLLGLLKAWLVLPALAILTLVVSIRFLSTGKAIWGWLRETGRGAAFQAVPWYAPVYFGLLVALGSAWLIHAAAPEIQYDSVYYHLYLPRQWVETGRVAPTPIIIQSFYYLGAETLYAVMMMLGGAEAAKLLSFSVALLCCLAVYCLGREVAGASHGILAAMLFAFAPLVGWEASTTYVELFVAAYCTLSLCAVLRAYPSEDLRWFFIAGLCAGFAISAKVIAGMFIGPLVVLVAAFSWRATRRWTEVIKSSAFCACGAALAGFPWPLLRLAQTGNPVFPFFNNLFGSPLAPASTSLDFLGIFGIGKTPLALARLPWEVSFGAGSFGEALPPNAIGATVLLALLASLAWGSGRLLGLVGLSAGSYWLLWGLSSQYLRYLLPGFPAICLLASLGLEALRTGASTGTRKLGDMVVPFLVLVLLGCGFVGYARSFFNVPERIPWKVAFGLEKREDYLERVLPAVASYRYLEEVTKVTAVKLLSLGEASFLYFRGAAEEMMSPSFRVILSARSPRETFESARSLGFTHVLVNRRMFPEPPAWLNLAQDEFLERFTKLVFAWRGFELYALQENVNGDQLLASSHRELLRNGGFEEGTGGAVPGWQAYGQPRVDCSGAASFEGRCAVLVTGTSGFFQLVPVEPGKLYTLEHVSRGAENGALVRTQVNWVDFGGKLVEPSIAVWEAGEGWRKRRMHHTAPPGAAGAVVYANAHRGKVWIDAVSFAQH
jgi:hypothetical protein